MITGPARSAIGIELRADARLTDRLHHLTVASAALGRDTSVRVLVPDGFDPRTDHHLPVIWLLHGGMDDVTSWTDRGRAEALTAGLAVIVVMPEAGLGGWYSDWHDEDLDGATMRWETHHLAELRPWIEQRFATRTDRAGRAIAGLSMGGFGALSYAARHPELFGLVAAFSGAADILDPPIARTAELTATVMGAARGAIWGRWPAHRSARRARNPLDLAANLASARVELRTGNGLPGGRHGGADMIEAGVHGPMVRLHQRLDALGIDHVWDDYGPGAHDWPYWSDDLEATLPAIMATAASDLPAPETVAHLAYEPTFSAWGWQVTLDRPCLEPTTLTVGPGGFSLTGSGRGAVVTDAWVAPFAPAAVSVGPDPATTLRLVADADGRLSIPVDLGPANTVDVDDRPDGAPAPARTMTVTLPPGD